MAVIVFHKQKRERFALVGVAEGVASVCDSEGAIHQVSTSTLTVIEIDGEPPIELLAERRGKGSGSREIVDDLLGDSDE